MKTKPILEPKNADLVLEGGDMTAADLKAFRTLLRKSKSAIDRAQEKISAQPWIDEPVPTLQQLVALQRKQKEEEDRDRPDLPPGMVDIDESGIGGSPTPEQTAYFSAYIWSTRSLRKKVQEIRQTARRPQRQAAKRKSSTRTLAKRTKA